MPIHTLISQWFIVTQFHLLAAGLLGHLAMARLMGVALDPVAVWLSPLALGLIYLFNKLTDIEEDKINHPERVTLVTRWEPVLWGGVTLGSLLAGGLAWLVSFPMMACTGLALALGLLYSFPLIPVGRNPAADRSPGGLRWIRLKQVLLVKNLTSSVGWTLILVGMPLATDPHRLTFQEGVAAIYVALATLVIEIAHDLRDVAGDQAQGIPTLPVRFGPGPATAVAQVLNLAAAAMLVGFLVLNWVPLSYGILALNSLFLVGLFLVYGRFRYSRLACDWFVYQQIGSMGLLVLLLLVLPEQWWQ